MITCEHFLTILTTKKIGSANPPTRAEMAAFHHHLEECPTCEAILQKRVMLALSRMTPEAIKAAHDVGMAAYREHMESDDPEAQ